MKKRDITEYVNVSDLTEDQVGDTRSKSAGIGRNIRPIPWASAATNMKADAAVTSNMSFIPLARKPRNDTQTAAVPEASMSGYIGTLEYGLAMQTTRLPRLQQ
jgi:hypothetical protein